MEASVADLHPERLHTILEDGEFVLYRQRDPTDTPSRSLLVVIPRSEHPRPQAVRMLEHEHALQGDLDPAWALRPVALTTLEGRPALVLEDPGGELILQRGQADGRGRRPSRGRVWRPRCASCTAAASFTRTSNRPT
jgi:hypothetical protein